MSAVSPPTSPAHRTFWFLAAVSCAFVLAMRLPDPQARLAQSLCAAAALFHLREQMAGRMVRWAWPGETAFLAACLLGGWGLVHAIRLVFA